MCFGAFFSVPFLQSEKIETLCMVYLVYKPQ